MATIRMLFWDEIDRTDKIAKMPNQADEPDGKNYAVFRKCRAILDLTWSAGYPQTLAGNMRILFLSIAIIANFVSVSFAESNNYMPPAGYVPDADTAIKIAIAVWIPIYGEDNIREQAPYRAELINGVWHVRGSLPGPTESKDEHGNTVVEVTIGGVAEAEISKTTGEILKITHGE